MKTLFFIIVLSLAAGRFSSLQAQVLWNGTTYGMPKEAVIKQFPTAYSDTKGRLILDGLVIMNHKFQAIFLFDSDKLDMVTLRLADDLPFAAVHLVFDNLTDVLRSKYGEELSQHEEHASLRKVALVWSWKKTTIELKARAVDPSEEHGMLSVTYTTLLAQEAENL